MEDKSNNSEYYHKKYLKYKLKYNTLSNSINQSGGGSVNVKINLKNIIEDINVEIRVSQSLINYFGTPTIVDLKNKLNESNLNMGLTKDSNNKVLEYLKKKGYILYDDNSKIVFEDNQKLDTNIIYTLADKNSAINCTFNINICGVNTNISEINGTVTFYNNATKGDLIKYISTLSVNNLINMSNLKIDDLKKDEKNKLIKKMEILIEQFKNYKNKEKYKTDALIDPLFGCATVEFQTNNNFDKLEMIGCAIDTKSSCIL